MNAEQVQLLRFRVGERHYALPVEAVKEIIPFSDITRVPRTPPVVRGVINLRGNVVPVLDLAVRMGHGEIAADSLSCVLIIGDDEQPTDNELGLLVSAVEVVLQTAPDELQSPPQFGLGAPHHFVSRMAAQDGVFAPILDLSRVADIDELALSIHEESERQRI
ncbi:MAG: chemotaxis protein CheW [Leptospirales bacterium]|nr:chemotaxis protein CheW [Leptospirales bacterium]